MLGGPSGGEGARGRWWVVAARWSDGHADTVVPPMEPALPPPATADAHRPASRPRARRGPLPLGVGHLRDASGRDVPWSDGARARRPRALRAARAVGGAGVHERVGRGMGAAHPT